MRNIDKFRGCLIGGAAGDALGYAVEFKREDEIFSEYGKKGITEYDLILDTDYSGRIAACSRQQFRLHRLY